MAGSPPERFARCRERLARSGARLGAGLCAAAALLLAPPARADGAPAAPRQIAAAGKLVYCSDLTTPPLGFLGEDGEPMGLDVELGRALARRLGVTSEFKNIPFKGIVPALLARECDAVISQLFIKPERLEVLDFVPYMNSSESLLVRAGSGADVTGLGDLSGLRVAVQIGTTIQAALEEQSRAFQAAGKAPLRLVVFPRDTDALQQLRLGQADVYGTTLETAAHYMAQAPGVFALAGPPFRRTLTGIGVRKGEDELRAALAAALEALRAGGEYAALFAHWQLQAEMLP